MIRAKFAYYNQSLDGQYPEASYLVLESDNKALPLHGNVCAEQLHDAGVPLPFTPTYQTWLNMGEPVYRGEKKSVASGKILTFAFMVAVMFMGKAHAWEFMNNPDRFPSLGFHYQYEHLENAYPKQLEIDTYGADIRLPLDQNLTVEITGDKITNELLSNSDTQVNALQPNIKGYKAGIGFRVYFNK